MPTRIIPRNGEEIRSLIKPLYDQGQYAEVMDRMRRYYVKKKRSSVARSEFLTVALPTVYKSGLYLNPSLLVDYGGDELINDRKADFETIFNSTFEKTHQSVSFFLRQHYKSLDWNGYSRVETCYSDPYHYWVMLTKEMRYHRSVQYGAKHNRVDILARGVIESRLQQLYDVAVLELRESLGLDRIVPRWKTEYHLYERVKLSFPQITVIFQGSPTWLGSQRFDIWLPEVAMAIEYNGLQHYEPLDYFGGQEGFEQTLARDADKRKKASENGTLLLELKEGFKWVDVIQAIQNRLEEVGRL